MIFVPTVLWSNLFQFWAQHKWDAETLWPSFAEWSRICETAAEDQMHGSSLRAYA